MKLPIALMPMLSACVNRDNSVQIGDYRYIHNPGCARMGIDFLCIAVLVLACIAAITYIKDRW